MIDLRSERDDDRQLTSSVPPLTGELVVLRSCNDTWLLDPSRKRYRRIPRSAPVSFLSEVGHWEPYERLELDEASDDFTVVLNASGSNRHRSFRHALPCEQCGAGLSDGPVTSADVAS